MSELDALHMAETHALTLLACRMGPEHEASKYNGACLIIARVRGCFEGALVAFIITLLHACEVRKMQQ